MGEMVVWRWSDNIHPAGDIVKNFGTIMCNPIVDLCRYTLHESLFVSIYGLPCPDTKFDVES